MCRETTALYRLTFILGDVFVDLAQKIFQLYFVEKNRMRNVCKTLHIGERTFSKIMLENNWKKREKHKTIRTTELKERPYTSKEWLYEEYIVKNKTCLQIANEIDAGESTIQYWVNYYNIIGKKSNLGKKFSKEWREKLSISHIGLMTGSKNFNWKGGITPINKKIRGLLEYKKWKIAVLNRDSFKCQECGGTNELHVHHISPFSTNEELRFSVDNGITLCKTCHYKHHRRVVSGEETILVPA